MARRHAFARRAALAAVCTSVAAHAALLWSLPSAPPGAGERPEDTTAMHVRLIETRAAAPALATQPKPARQPGRPPAPPAATRSLADPLDAYLPSGLLDMPPLPRSAPDADVLAGFASSGLPLKLRLYVDEQGRVVDARVLQAAAQDEEAALQLGRMFRQMRFLPGRRQGRDVASTFDVEVALQDVE